VIGDATLGDATAAVRLIRETGFDWENNEVVKQRSVKQGNKEMKYARFIEAS
jgi:hypothetical protein